MSDSGSQPARKFGTFTGVFVPTLLTILGVIMYVRLGWVVGNAGLMGAWGILLLAIGITLCTGLSLSSIATNTRLGAGGPYAMIQRSLGLEVGGSIGVPLYLSRPLGVAMYIFGFREGWNWIFPHHDPLLVDLIVFIAIFGLAYISASLAFRVQYLIMAVIALSLVCIVISPVTMEPRAEIVWWGDYAGFPEHEGGGGADFWIVFAVFFPATTGILAGANMSGDLENPRKAIPHGTLWAIGISSIVYFALAWWVARAATPDELVNDYNVIIDQSIWGPGVLAGLLGATFSSALAGAVGGPRILLAMAEHRIVPKSEFLAETSKSGEPRNAIALTAILTLACVMFRDLNVIAPLVTMFFLVTYLMINVVLLVEGSLGLVSFRPTLRVHQVIPLLGALGCVFCMFIVNATFGLIAVGTSVAIYAYLSRQGVQGTHGREDVRSSIFFAVAEWAANKAASLDAGENVRAWKPNLMVPVDDPTLLRGEFHFIRDLCKPEGSVKLLGMAPEGEREQMIEPIKKLSDAFLEQDVFCSWSIVGTPDFRHGVMNGLETLQGSFFRPNILFLALPHDESRFEEFGEIIVNAQETGVGVLFLGVHARAGLAQEKTINLYVRPDRSGWSVEAAFQNNNLDLTLLIGYRLMRSWDAKLNIITVIGEDDDREQAEFFLSELVDLARFPVGTETLALQGDFMTCAEEAPQADISVLGLQQDPDFPFMQKMIDVTRSTCLFVADSGRESARA